MGDLCWKFTEYLVWIDHLDLFQLLLDPWISQDLTSSCFSQFIYRSGGLDGWYRLFSDFSFDLAAEVLASRFDIWPENIFKEIWAAFWRRQCENFDKWSLDFPIRPLVWKIRLLVRFLSKLPPRPICTHWSLNTLLTWGRAENEKMRVIFSCWNIFLRDRSFCVDIWF